MEELKDVVGFEGYYEISSWGRVWSNISNKWLSPDVDSDGYERVCLRTGRITKRCGVHRLVAQAFIPKEEGKDEVNHKDMNKRNNCVKNLEWVSHKENVNHADQRQKRKNGKHHPNIEQYDLDGNYIATYDTYYSAARSILDESGAQLNSARTQIARCAKKQRKTAYGYIWKYEGDE